MTLSFMFPFFMALVNRIRGGFSIDNYNRLYANLILCMLLAIFTSGNIILSLLLTIGWLLGSLLGWGRAVGSFVS